MVHLGKVSFMPSDTILQQNAMEVYFVQLVCPLYILLPMGLSCSICISANID